MQATEAPPAEPSAAPSPDPFQAAVLAALESITGQMQALSARVEDVEQRAAPKFVPANPEQYDQQDDIRARIDQAPTDGIPRSDRLLTFPNGERVPEFVMRQMRPRFGVGARVRMNLDAVPHGRDDGKTRGQLMREAGAPTNGIGEVFGQMFLNDDGAWKYRVRFPKQMAPGAVNGILALYERELIPA